MQRTLKEIVVVSGLLLVMLIIPGLPLLVAIVDVVVVVVVLVRWDWGSLQCISTSFDHSAGTGIIST